MRCILCLQFVDEERLESIKAGVGLLKKLLRQKAVAELKAYRKEMEVLQCASLQRQTQFGRLLLAQFYQTWQYSVYY
jgi:hypothetical protein